MTKEQVLSAAKSKPKFPEPPPQMDTGDPRWPQAFQEWWWRKCDYIGVDPMNAFMAMLDDGKD